MFFHHQQKLEDMVLVKATQTGKEDVRLDKIEPVGNYVVKLVFDDGHNSGLYSWEYL